MKKTICLSIKQLRLHQCTQVILNTSAVLGISYTSLTLEPPAGLADELRPSNRQLGSQPEK